jgi:hypothetical protein
VSTLEPRGSKESHLTLGWLRLWASLLIPLKSSTVSPCITTATTTTTTTKKSQTATILHPRARIRIDRVDAEWSDLRTGDAKHRCLLFYVPYFGGVLLHNPRLHSFVMVL